MTGGKNHLYSHINSKRKTRENVGKWKKEVGKLATKDKVVNFYLFIFNLLSLYWYNQPFGIPCLWDHLETPWVEEDQVTGSGSRWNTCHLDTNKSMTTDEMHTCAEENVQCHSKAILYHPWKIIVFHTSSWRLEKNNWHSYFQELWERWSRELQSLTVLEKMIANNPGNHFKIQEGQECD